MINKLHKIIVDDIIFYIQDLDSSSTMNHMIEQVFQQDEYNLKKIDFMPGDIVLDIGANVGCVSILLAKKYPFLEIYSFEAHPINYNNLVGNIKLNDIENIKPYNLIVSDSDENIIPITLEVNNTGATSLFKSKKNDPYTFDIKTISLDTIIKNNNINNVKLLKLDCEGSEFEILQNSKKLNNIKVENIAIEIHTFNQKGNVDELINLINNISINNPIYKIYTLG